MATSKTPEDTTSTLETAASDSAASGHVRGALRDPTAVLERVVQGAHEAIDRVAATTIPAVEQWTQKASHAGEALHERADRLGEIQEQWLDDARHTVREHPIASVLAAVALGMLVARLTSR
jgi:ElaB/YqjD/DUF883 family membrane-anchored ribosome-binding protein